MRVNTVTDGHREANGSVLCGVRKKIHSVYCYPVRSVVKILERYLLSVITLWTFGVIRLRVLLFMQRTQPKRRSTVGMIEFQPHRLKRVRSPVGSLLLASHTGS